MRLIQGDMRRATVYGTDPAATARDFEAAGARMIHVVDLDGAVAGAPRNLAGLRAIRAAVRCQVEVSGGLRSMAAIEQCLAAGADRIALGSAAFLDLKLLGAACRAHPGRVFGSLDAREGRLAIRGWLESTPLSVAEAALRFRRAGVGAIIYTDIARDGTEHGADTGKFAALAREAGVKILASGGIASLGDIRALRALYAQGVAGAIVGRAIYEKRFTLQQALAAAR